MSWYITVIIVLGVLVIVELAVIIALGRRAPLPSSAIRSVVTRERSRYDEMKQSMTSNIAHELRTPVSSIRGYLETLENFPDLDPEKKNFFISRAFAQCVRLSELLKDISLLSKINDSPDMIAKAPVNIRELLSSIVSDLFSSISSKGDTVDVQIPDGVVVNGNRSLLYTLFRNLFENTLKYAGENVTIHLHCTPGPGRRVSFVYYDTGCGIAPKHLKHLFERFYRVDEGRTRTAATEGSGLGLALVKNIVRIHKGSITATTADEGGLRFDFTLAR